MNAKDWILNKIDHIRLSLKAKLIQMKYGDKSMIPQTNLNEYTDYLVENLGFYQIDPVKYSKVSGNEVPEHWLDTDHFKLYMVTLNEMDVGYFAFRIHENKPIAKVQQVHIIEKERGNGLGRIAVYHMESLAKKLGIEEIYAFDRCEEFWTKMGYTKTENISSELLEISYTEDEDEEKEDGFMVKNL